jgi:hypothetical protein
VTNRLAAPESQSTADGAASRALEERVERLELRLFALAAAFEAVISILAADVGDEGRRNAFESILVAANRDRLIAEMESVTAAAAADLFGTKQRDLLRRARGR